MVCKMHPRARVPARHTVVVVYARDRAAAVKHIVYRVAMSPTRVRAMRTVPQHVIERYYARGIEVAAQPARNRRVHDSLNMIMYSSRSATAGAGARSGLLKLVWRPHQALF